MLKRRILLSSLGVFLILLVLHVSLQAGLISNKVREAAEDQIGMLLGLRVQIKEARLRLLSASVVLKGISTATDLSPSVLAEEVAIYVSPWSFFTQTFFIREMVIKTPFLSITQRALRERPFPYRTASGKTPPVIVRRIQIHKGNLSYNGEDVISNLLLTEVNATIEPDLNMQRFEVVVEGKGGRITARNVEKGIDRWESKLVFLPGEIALKVASVISGKTSLQVVGAIRTGEGDSSELQVDAAFPIEEWGFSSLNEKRVAGKLHFQGRLTGPLHHLKVAGVASLPHLFSNGIDIGGLRANLSYQDERASLSSLSGTLFSGTFSGSAEGGRAEGILSYQLMLGYRMVSLEQIRKGLFPTETSPSLEGIFSDGYLSLSGKGADEIIAESRMEAKRLAPGAASAAVDLNRADKLITLFEEGGVLLRWSGRRLTLDQGMLRFPDTTATFEGSWDTDEGFLVKTDLTSKAVQKIAGPLDFSLAGRLKMEGTLTGFTERPIVTGRLLLDAWSFRNQPFGTLRTEFRYQDKTLTFREGYVKAKGAGSGENIRLAVRPTPMDAPDPSPRFAMVFHDGPLLIPLQVAAPIRQKSPPYRFEGDIHFSNPNEPAFEFKTEIASASPQDILSLFKFKRPIALYTTATGRLAIHGTPHAFSVHGPLTLGPGTLYREPFDRGKLVLTVTEKEVVFRKALLERGRGRAKGEGTIQYQGTFQINAKGEGINLKDTDFFASRVPLLSGNGAIEVLGEGRFQGPKLAVHATLDNVRFGEIDGGEGTIKAEWQGDVITLICDFPKKELFFKGSLQMTALYPFSFESRFVRLRVDSLLPKKALKGKTSLSSLDRPSRSEAARLLRLSLTGKAAGDGNLSQPNQINLAGSIIEFFADLEGYPITNDGPISFYSKKGAFTLGKTRLKGKNTALDLGGTFVPNKLFDLSLQGEADLNLIRFFTKELVSGSGKAVMNLTISDQWSNPNIRGEFIIRDGTIRLRTQSIHIASLRALLNERRLILESFEGAIGTGRFHASGKGDFSGFKMANFGFLLGLDHVRLGFIPDLLLDVTGDLLFYGDGEVNALKGDLIVAKGSYEKKVDLAAILALAKKTEEGISTEIPIIGATELNIHLSGKENIWVNNNLAKIPLEVDLFLKGVINSPLLIGHIGAPKGNIYFLGNDFKVTSGSVEFLNLQKIHPTFDVKAKTKIRNDTTGSDYAVDLNVSGTLSQFSVNVASSPPLPEKEILAMLTGQAVSLVASEALTAPIRKLTGVDRIQVAPYSTGTKASGGARVTAEKHLLDDRLRVTTTFDPAEEQQIRMIYELNDKVSLIGEKDEKGQIGGDIRFRFEFR